MQLSGKILSAGKGNSEAWEPYYRARKMVEDGEDVIELTVGDHDIKTAPDIINAMFESARDGKTGYTIIPGIEPLRKAVAARVEKNSGVETDFKNVVITSGGQAALLASHLAVLNPGDRAIATDPFYPTYPGTIRAAGGEFTPLPARARNSFLPVREDIEAAVPGAKSLLFNSPNNPTGAVYPAETLGLIAEAACRHDLWLISDEVYETQIWQGHHSSIRELDGMQERTLVIGSMSKSHAMTGSRVGWIVGPHDVMASIEDLVTVATFGVPEFIQEAAIFALEQGTELEEQVAAPFRSRREIALRILREQQAVGYFPPSGAMYLMLNIRATGLSGMQFANKLIDEEKVAVMPGESFGAAAAGHIRIAMTVEDARFEDALGRLVRLANGLASKR